MSMSRINDGLTLLIAFFPAMCWCVDQEERKKERERRTLKGLIKKLLTMSKNEILSLGGFLALEDVCWIQSHLLDEMRHDKRLSAANGKRNDLSLLACRLEVGKLDLDRMDRRKGMDRGLDQDSPCFQQSRDLSTHSRWYGRSCSMKIDETYSLSLERSTGGGDSGWTKAPGVERRGAVEEENRRRGGRSAKTEGKTKDVLSLLVLSIG